MANLIGLDGWNTLPHKENSHDMLIPAEYATVPTVCVRCGIVEPGLKRHGVQRQTFMDTPMHGKRVGIVDVVSGVHLELFL